MTSQCNVMQRHNDLSYMISCVYTLIMCGTTKVLRILTDRKNIEYY